MVAILFIFLGIAIFNISYYIFFGNFVFGKNTKKKSSPPPSISVIICAKNEAENLKQNLPIILDQNYSNFEIILINDASTDETLEVMHSFQEENPKIQIVSIDHKHPFKSSKKYGLTLGIKRAKHEHLLFTDADCWPESPLWIAEMSAQFSRKKSLVLGYGGYEKIENSFLNKLIRFETVMTAISYFSLAKIGKAYMGVGRNLAYTKTEFFVQNGFVKHMNIRSGDDDLFISQAANSENTALSFSKKSFTKSQPKTTWKAWFLQKSRHVSTAKYYKPSHKAFLGLFQFSQFIFWVLFITLLITGFKTEWVLATFFLRWLICFMVFNKASRIFNEKDLSLWFPLEELVLLGFYMFLGIVGLFRKQKTW